MAPRGSVKRALDMKSSWPAGLVPPPPPSKRTAAPAPPPLPDCLPAAYVAAYVAAAPLLVISLALSPTNFVKSDRSTMLQSQLAS